MDQCRLITEGRSDIQEDSSASVNEQLSHRFWNCKRSEGVTHKKKIRRKQAAAQVQTQVFKKIKIADRRCKKQPTFCRIENFPASIYRQGAPGNRQLIYNGHARQNRYKQMAASPRSMLKTDNNRKKAQYIFITGKKN
jgi:hypothetical protein